MTVPPSAVEPLAVEGQWPDDELFLVDYLAQVRGADGEPLGTGPTGSVDTETPEWDPAAIPEFIRVSTQAGRGGVRTDGTAMVTDLIEVYGPRRRAVKALFAQVTDLMLALDRGGLHRGVLVDACYNSSAEAGEVERDEDDRRRSSLWTLEWRRHFGPTVYPA